MISRFALLNVVCQISYMCVREQKIDNKNVCQLTDDNLRALEVPIGKFSLFRDTWRGLAREACKLVIRACACSLHAAYLLPYTKCNFSHTFNDRNFVVYLI
jgi:hypothetical protein